MSETKIRDYKSLVNRHVLPYFGDVPFSGFNRVLVKKFVALMKSKTNRYGQPLSAKRIQNAMIPFRSVVNDAIDEHGWTGIGDVFSGVKLPRVVRKRVQPFSFEEWKTLMSFMLPWYRPYFEFAVQTGLKPSEQVALKWGAIDDEYIHIELSRVYNREKDDLKTEESRAGSKSGRA